MRKVLQDVSTKARDEFLAEAKQAALDALEASTGFVLYSVSIDENGEESLSEVLACNGDLAFAAFTGLLVVLKNTQQAEQAAATVGLH